MACLKEILTKFIGKEIFIKDTNGSSFGGILRELGEDYCVLGIARRTIIYSLNCIVSVEERVAPKEKSDDTGGQKDEPPDLSAQMTDE